MNVARGGRDLPGVARGVNNSVRSTVYRTTARGDAGSTLSAATSVSRGPTSSRRQPPRLSRRRDDMREAVQIPDGGLNGRRGRGTRPTRSTWTTTRTTCSRVRISTARPRVPKRRATTGRSTRTCKSPSGRGRGTTSARVSITRCRGRLTGGSKYRVEHRELQHDGDELRCAAAEGARQHGRSDQPGHRRVDCPGLNARWDASANSWSRTSTPARVLRSCRCMIRSTTRQASRRPQIRT